MTFEHLDDPTPPLMNQDRWHKVQQRSSEMQRKTRVQTRLVAVSIVVALGIVAAVAAAAQTSDTKRIEIGSDTSTSSSTPTTEVSLPPRIGPTQAELTDAFYGMLRCYEDNGMAVNRAETHMDIYEYNVDVARRFGTAGSSLPPPTATTRPTSTSEAPLTTTPTSQGPVTATTADPTSAGEICAAPFRIVSDLWIQGRGPRPQEQWTAESNACLDRYDAPPVGKESQTDLRIRFECAEYATKIVYVFITRIEGIVPVKTTTVAPNCANVPAAETWPTREELAQMRKNLPMGVPAGAMRTDMANWLDVLDVHLDEIRASGARKIAEIVTSSGMHVTLLSGTGPENFVAWLRGQDHDPKRLFIETHDSCPKSEFD